MAVIAPRRLNQDHLALTRSSREAVIMIDVSRPSRSRLHGAVAALAAACTLFGAVPASADTLVPGADESPAVRRETVAELANPSGPDRLPELKSKAASVISVRQVRLAQLTTRVTGGDTDCSRPAIANLVAADTSGLTAMGAQLAAETDVKRAKDVYRRLFTDLRVFGLESSRVYLSGSCSAIVVRSAAAQVRVLALDPTALATVADLPTRIATSADKARAAVAVLVDLVPDKGNAAQLTNNLTVLRSASDQLRAADQEMDQIESTLDGLKRAGKQTVRDLVKEAKAARKIAAAAAATSAP